MESKLNHVQTKQWDQLFVQGNLITLDAGVDAGWGLIPQGALAVSDGRIQWLGSMSSLPEIDPSVDIIDLEGRLVSPGIVDCHTHLVFGGSRAAEWQQRLEGTSYRQIAEQGGGILSTVRATRSASQDALYRAAAARLRTLLRAGVTTVEIKSGYGLDLETELKMLRVIRSLGETSPVDVHATFLGAHALPDEFAGRPDDYLDLVCNEMMPAAKDLATAVDIFAESIAFDLPQTERVLQAAVDLGFPIKIHAEQLSHMGSAKLAAEMGAVSADHLEYLQRPGVEAMARHQTVATLLPGAYYFLGETERPPVEALREMGVPIALGSDMNPGSSPLMNPLLVANMGCTLFGLTPLESIRGVTLNAARALGIDDQVGSLETGKRADVAVWDLDSPEELAYLIGHQPCTAVYISGRPVVNEPLDGPPDS
ncbi:MAG: imidazolonepropionase [Mariniblastus sp.]|nr:imidazolonepropionase [Mariniblastus sp.]